MKIVLTGGGSGGHITPILAVAYELKQLHPGIELIYIGQRGDMLADVPAQDPSIDKAYTVRAGKFRRYHGKGFQQFLNPKTFAKNARDGIYVMIGIMQSYALLRRIRPDIVFIKGGFVGVPVGLAAARLHIPFITHDSDALPGLANRIIAKWARLHAVALPKEIYHYPQDRTVTVGVPISYKFHPLTEEEIGETRAKLGLAPKSKVLLVTGGGNGARLLNEVIASCIPTLLERYPELIVVQLSGRAHEDMLSKKYNDLLSQDDRKRVFVKGFASNLYEYSGVANVVLTRAGGTTMAELAAQAKACVVVPNPLLTGGHQLKNANILAERQAIKVINETELRKNGDALTTAIADLLDNPDKAQALGRQLATVAYPDAARRLAVLLLEEVQANETKNTQNVLEKKV